MKKTAKARHKTHATPTEKTSPASGGIIEYLPLEKVLGYSFFYADLIAYGNTGFTSEEIPFTPPVGVPNWFAVTAITHVGHLHDPRLGVLTVFHVDAGISNAQDGTHIVKVSASMHFDRQAPDSTCDKLVQVRGNIMFYSAQASPKSAMKQFNTARINILANRPQPLNPLLHQAFTGVM